MQAISYTKQAITSKDKLFNGKEKSQELDEVEQTVHTYQK